MSRTVNFSLILVLGGSIALWCPAALQAGTFPGNGDVNDDGSRDLSDAIYLLAHLFQGGPAPAPCALPVEPMPLEVLLPATNQTVCYSSTFAGLYPMPLPIPDGNCDLLNCNGDQPVCWPSLILEPELRQLYSTNKLSQMIPDHVCSVEVADCVTIPPDCVTDPADCVTDPASTCLLKVPDGPTVNCFVIADEIITNQQNCPLDPTACASVPGECDTIHPAEGCSTIFPPGQDGSYQTGCETAGRFQDNTDGTVTDLCTGLMWTQDIVDADNSGVRDVDDQVNWCAALNACESLNFAGHTDWRLPSIRELESIVDYSVLPEQVAPGALSTGPDRTPMLDPAFADFITDPGPPMDPKFPKDTGFLFWSSTSNDQNGISQPETVGSMDLAYCLLFGDSDVSHVLPRWGGSMPGCLKSDNNCICAGQIGCVEDERFDKIFARACRTVPLPAGAGGKSGQGGATLGNGDVNGDNSLDLSDAIYLLTFLFQGGPSPVDCPAAGGGAGPALDVNNVGRLASTLTENCYQELTPDNWDLAPSCAGGPCPGQDGFYQQEPPATPANENTCYGEDRFVVNDDNKTTTDHCTNLMWMRGAINLEHAGRVDWASAMEYTDALVLVDTNTGGAPIFKFKSESEAQIAGDEVIYDDWRVPNIRELETIRDYDAQAQRLAGNSVFVLQSRRIAYFSSTTLPSQPGRVFGLNAGARVAYLKNNPTLHVRPVRTVTVIP